MLKLMNESNKVVEYKISIQKSIVFQYTNNKISKKEIINNPINNSTKNNKVIRRTFAQGVKDINTENNKVLMKEIVKDTSKWKYTSCSWMGRINIVEMSVLSKAIFIYRFDAIPIGF